MGTYNTIMFCSRDEAKIEGLYLYIRSALPLESKCNSKMLHLLFDSMFTRGSVEDVHYMIICMHGVDADDLYKVAIEENNKELWNSALVLFNRSSEDEVCAFDNGRHVVIGDCWEGAIYTGDYGGYALRPIFDIFTKETWPGD